MDKLEEHLISARDWKIETAKKQAQGGKSL